MLRKNAHTVAVNIPADGLFLAILRKEKSRFTKEGCTRIIEDYIDRHLEAGADIIFLNVCYRRCLTPSEVFDSYLYDVETDENGYAVRNEKGETKKSESPVSLGCSKYFDAFFNCARVLLAQGIDIYETAIRRIRKANRRVFLSLRMNDGHYTNSPGINSPFATKNGGENTIDNDGVSLDFSKAAVQNHFLEYIEELLLHYAVDGIELDWLRYPTVLPEEKRGDFSILNGYMAKVRALMDRHSKALGLAVRLFPNEADNLKNGADVAAWIGEGCTDLLTLENFYIPTNYEIPVWEYRESIEKRNAKHLPYTLLCGSDWGVCCIKGYHLAMSSALVRGFTAEALQRGADGVYLFNFFEEEDTSSFELSEDENGRAALKNCFAERMAAAKDPLGLPRSTVHIGDSVSRYPIRLPAGASYSLTYEKKQPSEKSKILVGCDTDLSISLALSTQNEKIYLQNEKASEEFSYIPKEKISPLDFIYSPSQAAPFLKAAEIFLEEGSKETVNLTLKNESDKELNVLWLEIIAHE
jgi:hypothetical protein